MEDKMAKNKKDVELTEEESESKNGAYHGDPVLIFD